jgi:hypothetical protein
MLYQSHSSDYRVDSHKTHKQTDDLSIKIAIN